MEQMDKKTLRAIVRMIENQVELQKAVFKTIGSTDYSKGMVDGMTIVGELVAGLLPSKDEK